GGVATGFSLSEYSFSGKWLELLKTIAPGVTRVAVLRDPAIATGGGQFAAIQSAAPSLRVEVSPINVRDAGEIERTVTAFAGVPNGGLIVTRSPLANVHRDLIINGRLAMSIASSRVRNRRTCQCKRLRSFNLSSTSRLLTRWALQCRCISSRSLTR